MYFVGVQLVIPLLIPNAPPAISVMLSYPQLITASIGGAIAVLILPVIKKAIRQE
jgi:hypothetical protein